jgi:hypothetical protein
VNEKGKAAENERDPHAKIVKPIGRITHKKGIRNTKRRVQEPHYDIRRHEVEGDPVAVSEPSAMTLAAPHSVELVIDRWRFRKAKRRATAWFGRVGLFIVNTPHSLNLVSR